MNTFEENVNQDLRNGISTFFELMLLVTILVSKIGEKNGLTGLYGGSRKVQCKRTYATIFFFAGSLQNKNKVSYSDSQNYSFSSPLYS